MATALRPTTTWEAVAGPLGLIITVVPGPSAALHAAQPDATARAKSLIRESIRELGGEERLRSVRSLHLTGNSYTNRLQDSANPQGPWLVDFDRFTEYQDLKRRTLLRTATTDATST